MQVMDRCPDIPQDDWQEVILEINRIASRPMNRYASDLPVQQRAKGAAFSLLRHLANEEPYGGPQSPVGSPRHAALAFFGVSALISPATAYMRVPGKYLYV